MIAVEPATGTWLAETDVTVGMDYAEWTADSRTLFEDGEWKSQELDVEGRIGDFDIRSDLRFEPYKDRFRDWITKLEWESDALALTLTTKLTRTTDWLILELEREWEEIEIGTSFRLRAPTGGCVLVFYDAGLDVAFDWCGIDTDLEIAFDDDGFDEFVIQFSDLTLARIPWVTFDLELARTSQAAAVKLSPGIILESPWCVGTLDLEFEGSFPSEPNLLHLSIDEASLSWKMGDWKVEATATLEAAYYWLEVEADAAFDLGTGGEVSLDLSLLWTESKLGRARSALTYEPSDRLAIIIDWDIDFEVGCLDRLAVRLQIEW